MHIITRKTLQWFWEEYPPAENPLRNWFTRVKNAQWSHFADLRRDYPAADLVGRLTVFNIGGGNYRLVARIEYRLQRVYIRHGLTHAVYDRGEWKDDEWNA